MLSIGVIIFFSVVLFAYWFRYSCLLILQRASYSGMRAAAAGLSFPSVQEQLRSGEGRRDILDQLNRDLSSDYRILCFWLRCSPETDLEPMHRRMLMLDYWIMRIWYRVARRADLPRARKALEEISSIVNYFACSVGRNAVQHSNA